MKAFKQFQLVAISFLTLITFSLYTCQHSPTTDSIDTTDWKIYTDREHGFELMYPPDLTIRYPIKGYLGSVRFVRDSRICFAVITNSISPKAKVTYKGAMRLLSSLTLEDYFIIALRQQCFSDDGHNHSDSETMKLLKWKEMSIGGTEGVQAYDSDDECLKERLPKSLVIRNNVRYWFQIFHGSPSEYNKVLSTFRFIK